MARPREFEPNAALNRAMRLFWQKGYLDTSMEELVSTTGVSRYGFYSTFGDKRDLFLKAIEHYSDTVISLLLGPMETPNASIREIHRYFNHLLTSSQISQEQVGCLIGNTAMEMAEVDEAIAAKINNHFARMRGAFLNALQNAALRGEISPEIDVEAHADYLVGVALGFLACIRAKMSQEALERFVHVALVGFS